MAPTTCPIQEYTACVRSTLRANSMPSVTAGLMWQPEIGPITYAMINSDRPNPKAMIKIFNSPAPVDASPSGSSPSVGSKMATPGPPSISTRVPTSSAARMRPLFLGSMQRTIFARASPNDRSSDTFLCHGSSSQ